MTAVIRRILVSDVLFNIIDSCLDYSQHTRSGFYDRNLTKSFPGSDPHKEHTCETSAPDVNVQHKIWRVAQPTNELKID